MKIGIITSGGDSPGMNKAVHTIVKLAPSFNFETVLIENGYIGIINKSFVKPKDIEKFDYSNLGGTVLGTIRFPEFQEKKYKEKAIEILKKENIGALIVIGGDGTFQGALKLSEMGLKTIGIPATIDNDLSYTEKTLGFDTAANCVVEVLDNVKATAKSHERCLFVEIMGNTRGDLTLFSGLSASADMIVIPEMKWDYQTIINKIKEIEKVKKYIIVAISEKTWDLDKLVEMTKKQIKLDVRSMVIGYFQRGGAPTMFDRILATKFAMKALQLLKEQKTGYCVGNKGDHVFGLPIKESVNYPRKTNKLLEEILKRYEIKKI